MYGEFNNKIAFIYYYKMFYVFEIKLCCRYSRLCISSCRNDMIGNGVIVDPRSITPNHCRSAGHHAHRSLESNVVSFPFFFPHVKSLNDSSWVKPFSYMDKYPHPLISLCIYIYYIHMRAYIYIYIHTRKNWYTGGEKNCVSNTRINVENNRNACHRHPTVFTKLRKTERKSKKYCKNCFFLQKYIIYITHIKETQILQKLLPVYLSSLK